MTLNIIQSNLIKNPTVLLENSIEKCEKVVLFLNFFLLTMARKLLKILYLIINLVSSIPMNLLRPLNSIVNDKFKGLFAINELNFQKDAFSLKKNTEYVQSPLKKLDSPSLSNEKIQNNEKIGLFSFDKESFEAFMKTSDNKVLINDLKAFFIEIFAGFQSSERNIAGFIENLRKDPIFGFLSHGILNKFIEKLRKYIAKTPEKIENLDDIMRSLLEITVFTSKSEEISRLFAGIAEIIELVTSFSKEIKRKFLEKDPFFLNFTGKPAKFQINEFISKAFKKIGVRMDGFNRENSLEINKDGNKESTLEKFYNYGEKNEKTEEKIQKTLGIETNFCDFIEKAHERNREKDPKVIYTEYRKKKNKENESFGENKGQMRGDDLGISENVS